MISSYGHQLIEQDDIEAVNKVLQGDWLTTGPLVEEFENSFAQRVGAGHAIACSSGTAALHLVSMAAGLGAGYSSIVPTVSFLATANCSRFIGADVLFSDVNPDTGLMQVQDMLEALDRQNETKAKALYLVHLNGQTCQVEEMSKLAKEHGLIIIEDCCHALGTSFQSGSKEISYVGACDFSDFSIFSFHPVKTITTGEGGMVTTNNPEYAAKIKMLRNHGMLCNSDAFKNRDDAFDHQGNTNPWYYEMQELGLNYRISDINCALGLSQLKKLDRFIEKRRSLMKIYDEELNKLPSTIKPVGRIDNCSPVLHLYPVLIDFIQLAKDRADVVNNLKHKGVGTQVHYYPIHKQPYYENLYGASELPGASQYYERILSLPFHCAMTEDDVKTVVSILAEVLDL